jgi:lysozyme family protein
MATFGKAFDWTLRNEGGLTLTDVKGDRGGQTFAGITRRNWPLWPGWSMVDGGDRRSPALVGLVREFYRVNFWLPIQGDRILNQEVAGTVYDFAVNAGVRVAVKLLQEVLGAAADGVLGPGTLAAMNAADPHRLLPLYTLARVRYRTEVCRRDRTQLAFLLGWVDRDLSMS